MNPGFYSRFGKRAVDLILSAAGLLILSPLLVALGLLVRITSRGPAFYRQDRVGRAGRIFRIAKFRTMFHDTRFHDGMLHGAVRSGPLLTAAGDPRITRLGKILRRYKLDELPQLWNVLIGEMSIVGPRPEVPHYVSGYSPDQRRVLTIRPGITDPASLAYCREEDLLGAQPDPDRYYRESVLPDKLSLNLEYLNNISLLHDLSLVLQTTRSIFAPVPSTLRFRKTF